MGAVVLDASVVIGWLDADDAHHTAAEGALSALAEQDLRLPASAYSEVLVRPAAAGAADDVRDALAAFGVGVDPVDQTAAEAAAGLRARHATLRLPDALVLGHAESIGADIVLTTDARWKRFSRRVRVVG